MRLPTERSRQAEVLYLLGLLLFNLIFYWVLGQRFAAELLRYLSRPP